MTRKDTRNASALRGIAPFIAVLTVMIALAALAQTRAGQSSGKSNAAPVRGSAAPSNAGSPDSGTPLFLPGVPYDSGGNDQGEGFRSVAVADVNGDGKLDLVVANYSSNTLGVLLGNGDGTFQTVVTFNPGGQTPRAIAIADLNGDSKPDLVVLVTDGASGEVAVLLGNGDGTFQSPVIVSSSPGGGNDVAVADVNRDGIPDVIFGSGCGAGCVGVLLGNGDGTFQPAMTFGTGTIYAPASMALADVNGDGKLDLLTANFQANTVSVLLGNGDGTFNPAVTYGSGGFEANSIAVADVNGDHKPDLVVANCGTNNCPQEGFVAVLLGNGDGTFQPAVNYDSGGQAAFVVAIADVDGGGKPDLLATNAFSDTVGVLLGNGDGTFRSALTYSSGGRLPGSIVVADLNGDGRPDLVVENECNSTCNSGNLGVLLNNTGPHSPSTTTLVSSLNPAPPRKAMRFTATVTSQDGGAVTGSVVFQDGGSTMGTAPLAGSQAVFFKTFFKSGPHPITATYSGDLHNLGSTSATLVEYVSSVSTKTVVTTSVSPSYVGQPVTFTATITPNKGTIPDGEVVTFYDGTTAIGTGGTASGVATFTTSSLKVKTHTIKATYAGDDTFIPSSGTVQQVVNKYPTTTALTSSLNPSQFGQAVTFSAHVTSTGPAPTGSVKFLDGTTGIGLATLSGGVAKLTKSTLAVGTHPITAHYNGDAASSTSTSSVVNQVVQ